MNNDLSFYEHDLLGAVSMFTGADAAFSRDADVTKRAAMAALSFVQGAAWAAGHLYMKCHMDDKGSDAEKALRACADAMAEIRRAHQEFCEAAGLVGTKQ